MAGCLPALRPARHRHRLIADPLQIGIDFDSRQNEAQIHGHGLLHRQKVKRHLIDLAFRAIDDGFIDTHFIAGRQLTAAVCVEGKGKRLFGDTRHLQKAFTQTLEFLMERDSGH